MRWSIFCTSCYVIEKYSELLSVGTWITITVVYCITLVSKHSCSSCFFHKSKDLWDRSPLIYSIGKIIFIFWIYSSITIIEGFKYIYSEISLVSCYIGSTTCYDTDIVIWKWETFIGSIYLQGIGKFYHLRYTVTVSRSRKIVWVADKSYCRKDSYYRDNYDKLN